MVIRNSTHVCHGSCDMDSHGILYRVPMEPFNCSCDMLPELIAKLVNIW